MVNTKKHTLIIAVLLYVFLSVIGLHATVPLIVNEEEYIHIYDPGLGMSKEWYMNDHCFVKDTNDLWHLFGIAHEEPDEPLDEKTFGHATADSLFQQPWEMQVHGLICAEYEPYNETVLWAPHIIHHEGLYYMYYCAGGADYEQYRIHLATSPNLWQWSRSEANPMITDGFAARDPFVMPYNGGWIMYYTATRPTFFGHHVVMYALSQDLRHWEEGGVAFEHSDTGSSGGPTESPYVVSYDGSWYLFVNTNAPYNKSVVYKSQSPFGWNQYSDLAGEIYGHCVELIKDADKWYISRGGWGEGGIYLAPFDFDRINIGVEENITDSEISIYPNPARNIVIIEANANFSSCQNNVAIEVYNMLGERMNCSISASSMQSGKITFTLDISALPAGPHIVKANGRAALLMVE